MRRPCAEGPDDRRYHPPDSRQLPLILFVLALVIAALDRSPRRGRAQPGLASAAAGRGRGGPGGRLPHLLSQVAAASIGWQVSPVQFGIGVADPAVAIAAAVSFWRRPVLRPAVGRYLAPFNLGVAVGHIRDAVEAGNPPANTFGILLVVTVIQMVLLLLLAIAARR